MGSNDICQHGVYRTLCGRCTGEIQHAGFENLKHALSEQCSDRDCEIHNPAMIEDEAERLTACAWFLAGAEKALRASADHYLSEIFGERDMRLEFLGASDDFPMFLQER